jgi:UDP-glucose 4-epimerase
MVLPRFVQAALRHEPLLVHGDGTQTRCFCHVNDTIEALVRLQNSSAAVGEVINVGSTHEISILDLARRVIALIGSRSEINLIPYSEAYQPGFEDMPRRKPATDKLQRLAGFTPATPLDAIIRSVAEHLRSCS